MRVEPVAVFLNAVRAAAASSAGEGASLPAEYEAALAPARRLNEGFGRNTLAWGVIDRQVEGCPNAAALLDRFRELPETVRLFPSGTAPLRDPAVELGQALVALEEDWLARRWPAHAALLDAARRDIAASFAPHEAACFAHMLDGLGMTDPKAEIPIYLTVDAPWPGAVTYRRRGGGGICFVSVKDHVGTLLYETMLHEATHALDVLTPSGEGVLERLRARLEEAGVEPRDRRMRGVPHTLMFVQAGETIRRVVDPRHVHYGDAAGYYDKVRAIADAELPVWRAHLDGELSRDEALDRIVTAVVDE